VKDFEGKAHYPVDLVLLPKGWTCAFVGEVCAEVQSGFASGEHNAAGKGVPHLRPMNIDRAGHLDMSVIKSVAANVDPRRLHPGDVLFNNTNSPVLVGKTAAVSRDGELAFSNHMTRLRPLPEIDYEFLAYHLHYLWMGGYFLHRCSKHVNQASISTETLAVSVPVVVPPACEQREIVGAVDAYFTRLDDAVASLERVLAKLKAYRASVLKAAIDGRLVQTEASVAHAENRAYEPAGELLARILKERCRRWEEAELARMKTTGKAPKDDRWKAKYQEPARPDTRALPKLPEGWCWATADQVGDILLGRQRSQAYLTGRWFRSYLRVANIKDDRIDFSDVEQMDFAPIHYEKYRLATGDILVSEGQSPHLVGQSAIYRGAVSELCFQKTLHRFRPIPGAPTSEFAQIVFRANVMLGVFKQVAPITTNIAHLTLEKFKASRFPLPPAPEQQQTACSHPGRARRR
jgi:type I restriction enzyme, S subunit